VHDAALIRELGVGYLSHGLTMFSKDGLLEIDNSAAERALRALALGCKKYLFAGSNCG